MMTERCIPTNGDDSNADATKKGVVGRAIHHHRPMENRKRGVGRPSHAPLRQHTLRIDLVCCVIEAKNTN